MATVTTNIAREYSDLDLNFTIHPVKKDINRHVGDMAVINSIKNLVLTNHYERPFQPDIGSNIRRLLFENMDTEMEFFVINRTDPITINFFLERIR